MCDNAADNAANISNEDEDMSNNVPPNTVPKYLMGVTQAPGGTFGQQFRAQMLRNVCIKIRNIRRTVTEIVLPLYAMATLFVMKSILPEPMLPPILTSFGEINIFDYFSSTNSHTIGVLCLSKVSEKLKVS